MRRRKGTRGRGRARDWTSELVVVLPSLRPLLFSVFSLDLAAGTVFLGICIFRLGWCF